MLSTLYAYDTSFINAPSRILLFTTSSFIREVGISVPL